MAEHGISPDGKADHLNPGSDPHLLFEERPSGKWYPRAVLVDSEQTVLDKIITSGTNFDAKKAVFYPEETNGVCVAGQYTCRSIVELALDAIRKT